LTLKYEGAIVAAGMSKIQSSVRLLIFAVAWNCRCLGGNFTTSISEAPAQDWNAPIWQPGSISPQAGNTYEVLSGGLVRNPLNSASSFPGDALKLDAGSILRFKPPSPGVATTVDFPGVTGNAGLILNGGGLDPGTQNTVFTVGGKILVASNSFLLGPSTNGGGRNFLFTASLSGSGDITEQNFLEGTGATILSSNNTYTGNWIVTAGRLTGTGINSLGTGNITIAQGSTFEVMYDINTPGVLNLQGGNSIMTLHQDCQFGAAIIAGTSLPPGTYSYSQLVLQFPGNFAPGGSGGIRVAPPSPNLNISANGPSLSLTFSTEQGRSYALQTKLGLLSAAPWKPFGSQIPGDGTIKSVLTGVANAQGFYRLLVQ
jgi:hypothetical protein